MRPETIAIDGPAGSGKSTIGQALAARLHYAMVDTGLIYRLVARGVLDSAVDPDDIEAVLKVAVGVLKDVQVARLGRWRRQVDSLRCRNCGCTPTTSADRASRPLASSRYACGRRYSDGSSQRTDGRGEYRHRCRARGRAVPTSAFRRAARSCGGRGRRIRTRPTWNCSWPTGTGWTVSARRRRCGSRRTVVIRTDKMFVDDGRYRCRDAG